MTSGQLAGIDIKHLCRFVIGSSHFVLTWESTAGVFCLYKRPSSVATLLDLWIFSGFAGFFELAINRADLYQNFMIYPVFIYPNESENRYLYLRVYSFCDRWDRGYIGMSWRCNVASSNYFGSFMIWKCFRLLKRFQSQKLVRKLRMALNKTLSVKEAIFP